MKKGYIYLIIGSSDGHGDWYHFFNVGDIVEYIGVKSYDEKNKQMSYRFTNGGFQNWVLTHDVVEIGKL